VLPIPANVCSIFVCPDNDMAASAWDLFVEKTKCFMFLTCAEILMHAVVHGGCTDTARESASAPTVSYDAKNSVCVLFCESVGHM